jgi:hypothetical protein
LNFFFGVNSSIINSSLTIPRFQNSSGTKGKYLVYELQTSMNRWRINKLLGVELNKDFYRIDKNVIDNGKIFCLATKEEIQKLEKNKYSKLININNFTDTSPDFRANLQVSIHGGGFSSYQSEYPYNMVTKKGSILSPISSLCNKNADENIIFLKNIYELPVQQNFDVFFVNIKTKKVLKKMVGVTNFLNEIAVEKEFIHPEVFLFTDQFLGIPIYCSIKDNHISLEHTHPPHTYILGKDKFKVVNELKKEFHAIIT